VLTSVEQQFLDAPKVRVALAIMHSVV